MKLTRWDIRREDEDKEEFESLKNSIEHGLFNPLTVAKMSNSDKLTVIAGRRRFKAVKELGWKQIQVIVLLEDATETDIKIIQVTENLQRKELKDVEAGFAILTSFESAGFMDHNEIIKGVKSIDNWFVQHNDHKVDWDSFIHNSVVYKDQVRKREETSELRFDEKFVNICKSIGLSPKFQYQLLQVVLQLDPDVLVQSQKIGLTTKKKMLLTHSKLREHPQIQKDLVKEIATTTNDEATHKVRQTISDLESGYIKKVGNQYWVNGVPTRDQIPKDEKRSKKKQ